jgi:hypothetical protein
MRGLGCEDSDTRTRIRGLGYEDSDARTRMRGLGCEDSDIVCRKQRLVTVRQSGHVTGGVHRSDSDEATTAPCSK